MSNKPIHGLFSSVALAAALAAPNAFARHWSWRLQWVLCYASGDPLHRVCNSSDEGLVHERARHADLPARRLVLVAIVIDPTTAQSAP